MEFFVDTSALVKFYYPEAGSEAVESLLLSAEKVVISSLSPVEVASSLARRQRERLLDKGAETRLWNAFQDDLRSDKIEVLTLDDEVTARAATLVRDLGSQEGLRALDALQLAAAMTRRRATFLSADQRLSKIAAIVGLRVKSISP